MPHAGPPVVDAATSEQVATSLGVVRALAEVQQALRHCGQVGLAQKVMRAGKSCVTAGMDRVAGQRCQEEEDGLEVCTGRGQGDTQEEEEGEQERRGSRSGAARATPRSTPLNARR